MTSPQAWYRDVSDKLGFYEGVRNYQCANGQASIAWLPSDLTLLTQTLRQERCDPPAEPADKCVVVGSELLSQLCGV